MADDSLIRARVAGRKAADDLADLYITESKRLLDENREHGLEASISFLERLRDNLIAIRPLPEKIAPQVKPEPVKPIRESSGTTWDDTECPDGYVLIEFGDEVMAETELAVMIGSQWVPKSVLLQVPERGDYVECIGVKEWFCEKEGLLA